MQQQLIEAQAGPGELANPGSNQSALHFQRLLEHLPAGAYTATAKDSSPITTTTRCNFGDVPQSCTIQQTDFADRSSFFLPRARQLRTTSAGWLWRCG